MGKLKKAENRSKRTKKVVFTPFLIEKSMKIDVFQGSTFSCFYEKRLFFGKWEKVGLKKEVFLKILIFGNYEK